MENRKSAALAAEFIGTFALVFVGAGAGALQIGGLVGVAFAHGLVVLGFAYAYGHVSGTHINPAVTVGLWAAKAIDGATAAAYVVVQLAGGVVAGFALRWLLGGAETGLGATRLAGIDSELGQTILAGGVSPLQGLVLETILTFFLVNAVLNAAVSGKAGNLAGVAIGMTLVFAILLGGPLTGASLNPARTLGPAVAAGIYDDLWLYFVGPPLGGLLAAFLYNGVFKGK